MFFKRLELHGFKSFGHKTTIDFQEGFTIVVGPNGCGKSNVLDGIRWVLGETSAKSLRGGRMGDVVFRGSASTKPAGLANATLTLDNRAGHLKIDQPEVSVTRRLFSNGDSEYQTNKIPCRMRDIHELFLDTGLGADGYSIIEQGQIGQMVAAKPNERRDIFEEAAGISRYKVRREETVRKLKRTEEDLLRLLDLVGEVERQCNSLKNQARKAQRHRRISRRLHRLQQRLIVLRHQLLTNEFGQVDTKRVEMEKNFEQAATHASQADAQIAKEQAALEDFQRQLQRLQQRRFELRTKLDTEKHRIELTVQKIKTIDERTEAIDKELESRHSRLTVLQGTIEALELDFAKEEAELGAGNADLARKVEELETLKRQNNAALQEVNALRNELRELRARENTLVNDKHVAEKILERLTDELGQTEFQYKELTEAIEKVEQALETAKQQAEQVTARIAALREEHKTIQTEIGEGDRTKQELGKRLDTLTRELHQATSRLQALKELEDSYEGYFRGVKEVMRAHDKGQLNGIVGIVSSLINVPKHLEIAVEVALGSDVQDIITVGVNDAKAAIAFLKQRNLGRATFLPLDFLHSDFTTRHLEPIWGRQGVLGLGRDLVEFDPKINTAVNYLFGNTVIVDHLDVAVNLEREGIRNRFVSLQGDVVNPRGVLSGGSHQTRGLLTRQREIRQLQDDVTVREQEFQKLQQEMAAAKDRLGSLYTRAAEIQSEIHKLEMQESSVHKDLQQAERERKEKRNQFASVEARTTQQRLDQIRQREIIEKSERGLEEVVKGIEEKARLLEEKEASSGDLMQRQQKMSEDVAVAREAQNRKAESIAVSRKRLEEMRQSLDQSSEDQRQREEERTRLAEEREQSFIDREDAEVRLAELARAFEAADNEANDRSAANESLASNLRHLVSEGQRLQRDRNERDNALREIQMHCAELRAQIEYLEREAEDEFALTIDEVKAELAAAEQAEQEWRERKEAEKIAAKEKKKEAAKKVEVEEEQPTAEAIAEPASAENAENAGGNGATPEGETAPSPIVAQEPAKAKSDDEDGGEDEEFEEGAPVTTPEDDELSTPAELRALVTDLRQKLARMGAVNEAAIEEYAKQSERLEFITGQRDDMVAAKEQLEEAIAKIDETTAKLFNEALEAIRKNFSAMFTRLFNGGKGDLILVEDEKFPEPGIDIWAAPPGKNIGGSITLMSGGEKALTAIALMFALFQYRPSPICILDEIDAPLDDVNVGRMCDALRSFATDTQFLIITHNKITMSLADTIYGVTMQEPGISKVVSVKFDEVEEKGLLEEPATVG